MHGDLKPENVLMSARGAVTLSDFGCSKVIISGNEYLERCNGTPAFLAPEMMRPQSRYRCSSLQELLLSRNKDHVEVMGYGQSMRYILDLISLSIL